MGLPILLIRDHITVRKLKMLICNNPKKDEYACPVCPHSKPHVWGDVVAYVMMERIKGTDGKFCEAYLERAECGKPCQRAESFVDKSSIKKVTYKEFHCVEWLGIEM
jgi:hypothetical protein